MSEQSTAAEAAGPQLYAEHEMQAVAALTAAALATADDGQRYDFGEIACRVITAVGANLGGTESLLAGRPGSWEADYVRQIVASTTPEDELWSLRTVPVRLVLDPVQILADVGIEDLFWAASDAIDARRTTDLSDEQTAALDAEHDALDALWQADQDAYATAYTTALREVAVELGITVPVKVTLVEAGHTEPWDGLAEQLHEKARARTPLPTSGIALQDYPPGLPGVIDEAAGRSYSARLAVQPLASGDRGSDR